MRPYEIASWLLPDAEMKGYVLELVENGTLESEVGLTDVELLRVHADPLVPRLRRAHIEVTMEQRGPERLVLVVQDEQDAGVFLRVFGLEALSLLPLALQPAAKRHLLAKDLAL